jgi:pimeloyl-ACP methyl ester carboxylesterase
MAEGFVAVDGGRLFYEEAGAGRAVVFIHPGLWDRRTWDDQFDVFAERFRTIRYDVRGYGKSSRPESEFSNVDDLHALMTQLDVERAALIGCSMGGGIAVDFTLEHPEMVDALVPVASALSGVEETEGDREKWGPVFARIGEAAQAGDMERATDLVLEVWAPLGTTDEAGARIRQISLENPQAITDEGDLERGIDPPATKRLGEIGVPTLIVLGAQDVEDINEMWAEYGPRIPGSRTVVIDRADHVVAMRRPKEFNELLLAFLTESGSS